MYNEKGGAGDASPAQSLYWETAERPARSKTPDWFWAFGSIIFAVAAISLIMGNFLLAIFTIVAAAALYIVSSQKPKTIRCAISKLGVSINENHYPYSEIKSFWISDRDGEPRLLLNTEAYILPYVAVPIPDDISPDDVRELLSGHLELIEQKESLSHILFEKFGF